MAYNQRLTSSTDRDCDTAADSALTTFPPEQTTAPAGTTLSPAGTTSPPEGTTLPTNTGGDSEEQPNGRSRRRQSERGVHNDYLLIPDGLYSSSRFASKYCDKSLENIDESTGNSDLYHFISLFFFFKNCMVGGATRRWWFRLGSGRRYRIGTRTDLKTPRSCSIIISEIIL